MKKIDYRNLELLESVVDVARVSKVTKGGRQFSFRVAALVGDRKGCVGYAVAKHDEMLDARNKAVRKAKGAMRYFHLKAGRTIHHDCFSKLGASKLFVRPAPEGTGIVAGGAVRKFCEMLGVSDIIAKSYGSSTSDITIRNAIKAFSSIYPPRYIANKRDRKKSKFTRDSVVQ
ncbi:ribosomal S5, N-terminal domain protein [Neorickettsia helminthoeca str. Oregon]|uniref:Small ribosomal subunit protein uS5 n=1 Tax=Neorickettsia helminthoeca str. Oregon TaxID=1286528 RepID=X5H3T7_9RICK|nr:30S ribosomal protein S5 [Neorickettsia helminthoeca]AHX11226.1 ribosomal S5, N-terminal domain protein [Neorickettsia helminthoeca str. Oregon]